MNILKNVQIWSALIWASVIMICSFVARDSNIATILITAAGFHVVLLGQHEKQRQEKRPISH